MVQVHTTNYRPALIGQNESRKYGISLLSLPALGVSFCALCPYIVYEEMVMIGLFRFFSPLLITRPLVSYSACQPARRKTRVINALAVCSQSDDKAGYTGNNEICPCTENVALGKSRILLHETTRLKCLRRSPSFVERN